VNRNSLRFRVTAFYVGMLAVALLVFSVAVYFGAKTFLARSLDRRLSNSAQSIVNDYLVPLDQKGEAWLVEEMGESYPPGYSDPFVRVSQGSRILYESGDMLDPPVSVSKLPLPSNPRWFNRFHRETAPSGQRIVLYTVSYQPPKGAVIFVETGALIDPIRHVLHTLLLILSLTTPVILIVAAIGGYVLMARPLRPVVVLTEQAEHVGRKALGERLPIIPTGDELERLSLALNRMIERLEAALAHNHRFSADASHELRTPLTIIRGELESMIEMPSLPAPVMEGLGSALEESARMAKIVHSLMTISRMDCGDEPIELVPVNLVDLVNVTLDQMSLLAEEKNISLRFTPGPATYVAGDSMRLKQIVVNLVDNAIKYTAEEGDVSITVAPEENKAVLKVSDTGIGIPPASLPLVFDRFYRADEARSRESGGTGLGLSIVKAICNVHHGAAFVESVEGKGTTLRIELPLLLLSAEQIDQFKKSPHADTSLYSPTSSASEDAGTTTQPRDAASAKPA
jgi:signal transduction histidine kinase